MDYRWGPSQIIINDIVRGIAGSKGGARLAMLDPRGRQLLLACRSAHPTASASIAPSERRSRFDLYRTAHRAVLVFAMFDWQDDARPPVC